MNLPYLIQRGEFKDTPEEDIVGLDSLISYDYMGAAEFEFGALFHALDHLCQNFKDFQVTKVNGVKDYDGQQCFIICPEKEIADAITHVTSLVKDESSIRTKERVGLQDYVEGKYLIRNFDRVGFWWAFEGSFHQEETQWMCCFGSDAKRLVKALRAVYEKKMGKPPKGGPEFKHPILDRPDPDLIFEEDYRYNRWVIYHENSSRKSYIARRKVSGYTEYDDKVEVKVISKKTGGERKVNIYCSRSPRRNVLLKILDDEIRWYKMGVERAVANG